MGFEGQTSLSMLTIKQSQRTKGNKALTPISDLTSFFLYPSLHYWQKGVAP